MIINSLIKHRNSALYQILVITIITAVVTVSLLTDYSVRQSLKDSAEKRLGNTGLLISSGLRYFKPELDSKLTAITGIKTASILETEGMVEKSGDGSRIENIKIYGIRQTFFRLNNISGKYIDNVDAAINEHLAKRLNLSVGDEIIVTHRQISDLPSSAPFAPSAGNISTHVFKIKYILTEEECGNFSSSIKKTSTDNVFVNISELSRIAKANRILVDKNNSLLAEDILEKLKSVIVPSDLGLKVRKSEKTGFNEILSGRIFFDSTLVEEIKRIIPGASPVMTYLVNSTVKKGQVNTYSFASAVEDLLSSEVSEGNKILINKWLANDIGAKKGDTLTLTWYNPDRFSCFEERQDQFIVHDIVEIKEKWNDPELMPEFPGISGRKSLNSWDAGLPVKTELIRKKDEEYWNIYKGTPKIFLNYETGKRIWANNFGTATAIRVPPNITRDDIINSLTGSLDPVKCGFSIRNIRNDIINAANHCIDFNGFLIGLGFIIIATCFMLFMTAINSFLGLSRSYISSFFTPDFSNRKIKKLLLTENLIISFIGCITGVFAGIFLNKIAINSLNEVWAGIVQTDTIKAVTGWVPLLTGFFMVLISVIIIQLISIRRFLKEMQTGEVGKLKFTNFKSCFIRILISLFIVAGILLLLAVYVFLKESLLIISFIAGVLSFVGLILLWLFLFARRNSILYGPMNSELSVSGSYCCCFPVRIVIPVLIISVSIFAVIIIGIYRLKTKESSLSPPGGTGGFLLWAETTIPIKENLNTKEGKKVHGLSYFPAESIYFLQAKRLQSDDAGGLNLHHLSSPTLICIDPSTLLKCQTFSFSVLHKEADPSDPWEMLEREPGKNIIYGFTNLADIHRGLKTRVGDTLVYNTENCEKLYIVIAGNLKSSVFQGYIITGEKYFNKFFPSVPGYSIFLAGGDPRLKDDYIKIIRARFNSYGINIISTRERLEKSYELMNTYLSVFIVLGSLVGIIGLTGFTFLLRQNYNFRRTEHVLIPTSGFMIKKIRRILHIKYIITLLVGLITGTLSAFAVILPLLKNIADIPFMSILNITVAIFITGISALFLTVRSIDNNYSFSTLQRKDQDQVYI